MNKTIVRHESTEQSGDSGQLPFANAMNDMPSFDLMRARQERDNQPDKEYLKSHFNENIELLENLPDNAKHLKNVYLRVIKTFPELQCIKLRNENSKETNGNAFFHNAPESGPYVRYNFSHIETYAVPSEDTLRHLDDDSRQHIESRIDNLIIQANLLGADPNEVLNNWKLFSTFVFLHEIGHGFDHLRNYLGVNSNNYYTVQLTHSQITEAAQRSNEEYKREKMAMPIPDFLRGTVKKEGNLITKAYDKTDKQQPRLSPIRFKKRLASMGIDSLEELRSRQNSEYRRMKHERAADNFATSYIMNHFDDFFGEDEDKVKTHINKTRVVGEKEVSLLGLESGKYITINRLSKEGIHEGKPIEGFLIRSLKYGETPTICRDGKIDNSRNDNIGRLSSPVNRVCIRPEPIPNSRIVKNRIAITLEDGQNYEIEINDEKKPPKVSVDTEQLQKALNLSTGTEIQLLKTRTFIKDNDAKVREGNMLIGKLRLPAVTFDPNNKNPIQFGTGIYLDEGAVTTDVMSIYKQWNTYHVNTMTSDYEILPMS